MSLVSTKTFHCLPFTDEMCAEVSVSDLPVYISAVFAFCKLDVCVVSWFHEGVINRTFLSHLSPALLLCCRGLVSLD